MLTTGKVLNNRYEVQSEVDEGGVGAGCLALDRALGGKKVAIWEGATRHEGAEDAETFRKEAGRLSSLEHPGLVQVTDSFENDGNAYLVTAHIEGQALASIVAQRSVSVQEAVEWTDQLAQVFEYLHAQDPPIFFEDFGPGNVLFDSTGRLRVTGLRISPSRDARRPGGPSPQGAGATAFAAVEVLGGLDVDARADVYSLGAFLYHLVTGKLPPISMHVLAGESPPANPLADNPQLPPTLAAHILKAMALRKNDRHATVKDFRHSLSQAAHATPSTAAAPPTPSNGPTATFVPSSGGTQASPATDTPRRGTVEAPGPTLLAPQFPPSIPSATEQKPEVAARQSTLVIGGAVLALFASIPIFSFINEIKSIPPPSRLASTTAPPATREPATEARGTSTAQAMNFTGIYLEFSPPDARIFVDGRLQSGSSPLTIPLKPGDHYVRVEKAGYVTADRAARRIEKDKTKRIEIHLYPEGNRREDSPDSPISTMRRPPVSDSQQQPFPNIPQKPTNDSPPGYRLSNPSFPVPGGNSTPTRPVGLPEEYIPSQAATPKPAPRLPSEYIPSSTSEHPPIMSPDKRMTPSKAEPLEMRTETPAPRGYY